MLVMGKRVVGPSPPEPNWDRLDLRGINSTRNAWGYLAPDDSAIVSDDGKVFIRVDKSMVEKPKSGKEVLIRLVSSQWMVLKIRHGITPKRELFPCLTQAGIFLDESLQLTKILCKMDIDMLHVSCWDVFQGVAGDENGASLTKRFAEVVPEHIALISTGAVWTSKDAQWLMEEGADLVGVARVAIAHPDWPMHLADVDYSPQRPPFTEQHLLDVDLSPVFVEYMKRWKNFVYE